MRASEQQQAIQAERKPKASRASIAQRTRLFLLCAAAVLLLIGIAITLWTKSPNVCSQKKIDAAEALSAPIPTPTSFADHPLLTVSVFDVGQGDAILLQSPSGKTMLVDAGPEEAYSALRNDLKAYEIERLDTVIATHPHADHIGGMPMLLRDFDVGAFYLTTYPATTSLYEQMLLRLQKQGCPVYDTNTETIINWDTDINVKVLNPIKDVRYDDANNASIVLRVTYGEVSFLLTGDMEGETEQLLLDTFGKELLQADVLKLGHHGSYTSTSEAFLAAVSPRFALVSAGRDNLYGHPHSIVLERLEKQNITLYRTDRDGVITAFTDGYDSIIVQ